MEKHIDLESFELRMFKIHTCNWTISKPGHIVEFLLSVKTILLVLSVIFTISHLAWRNLQKGASCKYNWELHLFFRRGNRVNNYCVFVETPFFDFNGISFDKMVFVYELHHCERNWIRFSRV